MVVKRILESGPQGRGYVEEVEVHAVMSGQELSSQFYMA